MNNNLHKKYLVLISGLLIMVGTLIYTQSQGWGFWGHQRINRMAVMLLPEKMIPLYKPNIEYVTKHAVDPDMRRYSNEDEAPRHYIDLDHYGNMPFDNVPRKWKDAVKKLSEDTLVAYGIVPWHVEKMLYRLTDAFKNKDKRKILQTSAEIGHYVADACVPLHTTENYNGQKTNQYGIHGFWESRVPELMGEDYDYFIGKAEYIDNPNAYVWQLVFESHSMVDSVFAMEKKLTQTFPEDKKYSFESRGANTIKVYSKEFSAAYNDSLNNMAERRLRRSILAVSSFWYTAWVNAGQPDLENLKEKQLTDAEKKEQEELFKKYSEGKMKGRSED